MASSTRSRRPTGSRRSPARTTWSAPTCRAAEWTIPTPISRALRLRLGAQLHQLLQPRAREDVRAAIDRARPDKTKAAGLGEPQAAAGGVGGTDGSPLP